MSEHDLIVIGAGPGGYVAAIRAAQLGLNVACVDENAEPGGTCLRVGCIPSKAMLESSERYDEARNHLSAHGINVTGVKLDLAAMLQRKDKVVQTLTRGVKSLFKKNKVTHYQGRGRLTKDRAVVVTDAKGNEQTHQAKHVILATGSVPAALPGIDFSDKRIDTSTDALSYDKAPGKLAVIGAGYIGIELGSVWRRLGAEVTVVEYLDRILPGMDSELATLAHKLFKKQGFDFRLGAKVTGAKSKGKGAVVELEGGETVQADRVLVAVGRKPNTEGLGLDEAGVELDERGRVKIDADFKTNVEGVYAIGDVVAGAMLAHKAEDEGMACVEKIATGHGHVDYNSIPAVVYTHPEIASVGQTEEQLKEQGVAYRKGSFPFLANGRARSLEQTDGMVKILADEKTDRVLGVHILGARAGDLIAECATAMAFGASAEDIIHASHAHPTLAEAVREAAMAVHDRAIHV